MSLWSTKTSKSAAGYIVGVKGVAINLDIRKFIRAGTGEHSISQHFIAGIHIGPAVTQNLGLSREEGSIRFSTPLGINNHRVPFTMSNNRLLAAPDNPHRPAIPIPLIGS